MAPPATCRGTVDQTIADPAVPKRMPGMFLFDVLGGSTCVAEATNHLGLRGFVLDTKFGARFDVTEPLVSHQDSIGRLRWKKVHRKNDFTPTTAHFVLFQ